MKFSRKWLLVIALVMSLTMATAGTLAYLTDRDSEANVFTLGNVEIDLNETFDPEGAELIPGVDIVKEPTITNTGKNDAWVWATIAIPAELDDPDNAANNVVHFNFTKESIGDGLWNWTDENGEYMVEEDVEIGGVKYNVYTALYETALEPGETTQYPVITKVYLDPHIDIDPNGDVYHVVGGEVEGPFWNVNDAENPVIYVSAYAIQTTGFNTVQEGYAAYNEQWGDNGTEWADPDTEIDRPLVTVMAESAEDLADAIDKNSNTAVTLTADISDTTFEVAESATTSIDLAGNTISTVSSFIVYGEAELSDGTLTSSSTDYGLMAKDSGEIVVDNLDIVTSGGGVNVRSADATIIFNGGSVTTNSTSTSGRHVFYVVGNLVINDGEFTFSPSNLTRKGSYIYAHGPDANVVVNGGTFHKGSTRNGHDPIVEADGGTVTIYGGTFAFDPSAFVADGYVATKGADGYWTVAAE